MTGSGGLLRWLEALANLVQVFLQPIGLRARPDAAGAGSARSRSRGRLQSLPPRLPASLLVGLCLAMPVAAQQPGRTYRVALLAPGEASVAHTRRYTLPVLERAGFVEGRNLVLEVRVPGGAPERHSGRLSRNGARAWANSGSACCAASHRAIGIELPREVLLRADEVIE